MKPKQEEEEEEEKMMTTTKNEKNGKRKIIQKSRGELMESGEKTRKRNKREMSKEGTRQMLFSNKRRGGICSKIQE